MIASINGEKLNIYTPVSFNIQRSCLRRASRLSTQHTAEEPALSLTVPNVTIHNDTAYSNVNTPYETEPPPPAPEMRTSQGPRPSLPRSCAAQRLSGSCRTNEMARTRSWHVHFRPSLRAAPRRDPGQCRSLAGRYSTQARSATFLLDTFCC